ncbi:hypothetical protein, partial [Phocaeicola plebeius]|uniref:hypothetical protein n=1 Tax=Phocaeicola plebeius TaxID=310297 RepID=UPI0026EE8282
RGRPLLLFAAGFFLSFLFSLAILFSLAVTRTAFRNAPGDVFSTKESHSSPELSDTLKTNENLLGKKPVSGNMGLNHRAYNFYSCNFKN